MGALPPDRQLGGIIRHQILKKHPPLIGGLNITSRDNNGHYYHEAIHSINNRYEYIGRIVDSNDNIEVDDDEMARYLVPHAIQPEGEAFSSRNSLLTLSSGLLLETDTEIDTSNDGILQFDLKENGRTTTYTKHFDSERQARRFGKKLGKAMETGELATRKFLDANATNTGTWPPPSFD